MFIRKIEMKKRTLLVLVSLLCLSFSFSCGLGELRKNVADLKEENAKLKAEIVDLKKENLSPIEKANSLYQLALRDLESARISRHDKKDFYGYRISAFHHLTDAIKFNPDKAIYYYTRGKIRHSKKAETLRYGQLSATLSEARATTNLAQWFADLTTAISLEPSNPRYRLEKALAYHDIGSEEKAAIDFKEAIRLAKEQNLSDSQVSEYYTFMGMAYYTDDQNLKGETSRRKCIDYLTKAREIKKLPVDPKTIADFVKRMNKLGYYERKPYLSNHPDDKIFYDLVNMIIDSESYNEQSNIPEFSPADMIR